MQRGVIRAEGRRDVAGILWAIVVVLLVLWALGFFLAHLGSIIHLLLVIGLIVLLYNLFVGRRATTL